MRNTGLIFMMLAIVPLGAKRQQRANNQPYITIFAHGLGQTSAAGKPYEQFIGGSFVCPDGPELRDAAKKSPYLSHLAQESDIAIIESLVREKQPARIILAGVSKGAATQFNVMDRLEPRLQSSIAAVILESPFTSPEFVASWVAQRRVGRLSGSMLLASLTKKVLGTSIAQRMTGMYLKRRYKNYDPTGIKPIDATWKHVNKHVVVIFMHSQADTFIPIESSRVLYTKLKELGFKNVYLLEPATGRHAEVLQGSSSKELQQALCYIYLRHNLPLPQGLPAAAAGEMRASFATMPAGYFARLQPSVQEVAERLMLPSPVATPAKK